MRGAAATGQLLDRECPRCGAAVGVRCRDRLRPSRPAAAAHVARGWLDRRCPTCAAQPGERCTTPSGRTPSKPHAARWEAIREPCQPYGYACVSPTSLDARRQHDALTATGCARIWTDRPTTNTDERGELSGLLAYLRPGDILVVWRLDRLARTVSQLLKITAMLHQKRVELRSLEEQLDSTRPDGSQLFAAFAALGDLERHAGAERARVNGRRGGRPAALTPQAHSTIRAMYDAGEHTIDQIAAAHGVSRPTIYRSLQGTRRT